MRAGERVDGKIGGLAVKHPADLRLLEVRDDINAGTDRHDGHQLGAGLNVKAHSRGPVADRPVDRRFDHGVTKIEARLVEYGAVVLQCRLRLGALRAQHIDLFFGRREGSLIVFQRCDFAPQICGRLLGALNGTGTRLRIGLRLIDRRLVVARVDRNQHFARLDPLIIGHQQFGDIAGDPWHDRGIVGLGISVIGRFEPSPSGVPIPGETNGTDYQEGAGNGGDEQSLAPHPLLGCVGRRRLALVGFGGGHRPPVLRTDPVDAVLGPWPRAKTVPAVKGRIACFLIALALAPQPAISIPRDTTQLRSALGPVSASRRVGFR